ncbi:hypothetical protein B6U74_03790 [Candidatus Bathyarchaeota archaeon ex4484_205]|nr:MAG: hypothetical protein B6U74_03790 [Candidatus Bathyarchaeota archaeon ex4484_205]RLG69255.1 MAG: hypothetical protein DRN93_00605 [archaeon]
MISVVIPAKNEAYVIGDCLRSLRRQKIDLEIIVVCSGWDDTENIAKEYADIVVRDEGRGPSAARNLGAMKASNKILAFIDADSMVDSQWSKEIVSSFSSQDIVAMGGIILPRDFSLKSSLIMSFTTNIFPRIATKLGLVMLQGPNTTVLKDVFWKAGGYNENLHILEDLEIGQRIKKFGKVILNPNLRVFSSTRRFSEEGWLKATLKYWKAFVEIFLLKHTPQVEYSFGHHFH